MSKLLDYIGLQYYHSKIQGEIGQLNQDVAGEFKRYQQESVGLANVAVDNLAVSDTTYVAGEHFLVDISEAEMVAITGNVSNRSSIYMMRGLYGPNSGSTIGSDNVIKAISLSPGETVVERVPSDGLALIVNKTVNNTNVAPSAITLYKSSEEYQNSKDINGNTPRQFASGRFAREDNALIFAAYDKNRNRLIKVKEGLTYIIGVNANGAAEGYFISGLPRVGESTTRDLYFAQIYPCQFVYTAPANGYILFRVFNSSSPSLEITSLTLQKKDALIDSVKDNRAYIDDIVNNGLVFHRIFYNGYTRRTREILFSSGTYGSSTSVYHYLLPIKGGQLIKVRAQASANSTLAWLSGTDTPSTHAKPPYVEGTGLFVVPAGEEKVFKAPAGTHYLYVYYGNSSGSYWPEYLGISVDFNSLPDIVRNNDYIKTKRIFKQLSLTTRNENDTESASFLGKPLMLLHFTDLHGGTNALARINEYRKFYADYIDATLQTGDLLSDKFSDTLPYGSASEDNPNNDILGIIGNHDIAAKSSGVYDWYAHQGRDAYDKFFAPFISYWGVNQPLNAAENGLCYYYKDFSNSKIRLICLDTWHDSAEYHTAQKAWLSDVLNSAREAGLSVIMATHTRIKAETAYNTPFSTISFNIQSPGGSPLNDAYIPIVSAFKEAGGDLVCWLSGHSHYDAITKTSEENGDIINISLANANRSEDAPTSTLYNGNSMIAIDLDDYRTFDLFNIVAVDVIYKTITLFRVGSEWDKEGRKIETCCIKYTTGELIY